MPTKTSSRPPPRVISRSKAWSCLITNLLVLPGLGTVMAGKAFGRVQILSAAAGFSATVYGILRVFSEWLRQEHFPGDFATYKWFFTGAAMFLGSWIWSGITGILLLRQAPPEPDQPPQIAPQNGQNLSKRSRGPARSEP